MIARNVHGSRQAGIDIAKAAAITGVVIIHVSGLGIWQVGTADWGFSLFWGAAARASVPVFLMCSGALLLDPERELPLKKLYGRNILRIAAAMLFWAMAYKGFHLLAAHELSLSALLRSAKEVLMFDQEFHLYYIHIMLLVYVCLPVTRAFVKCADRRLMRYALGVWFAFGILYPTLGYFAPFRDLGGIPAQWKMNMTWAAAGYGILGYYIKKYTPKPKVLVLMLAAGFAVVFCGTLLVSLRHGEEFKGFFEGMTVGPALMAAGIFGLCQAYGNKAGGLFSKICEELSRGSFCIYLVHVFLIYILKHFGISAGVTTPAVSVPLVSLPILLGSAAVYEVLRRVPVVRSWLI